MQVPICIYTFAPVIRSQLYSLGFRDSDVYRVDGFVYAPEALGVTSTNQATDAHASLAGRNCSYAI